MFYPYITLGDGTEVVHTPLDKDKKTTVRFEKPDAVYCFKTLDCTIPGYNISNILGFTDTEVSSLIQFCRCNASLLLKYASEGGILNA